MTNEKAVLAIAVIALVTAALRFAPFVLFAGGKSPKWLSYFGEVLPYAVMAMLVVYCLRGVSFQTAAGFLPALIACAIVVGSYVWKRNTLLSILAGTVTYMLLVQFVFV